MHITIVPVLNDNYAFLVRRAGGREALVVDPGQVEPIVAAADEAGLSLVAVLCTHHHWDHTGGNAALRERFTELAVYGHASETRAIPGGSHPVQDGDELAVAGLEISVLHVPGHTLGAVAYRIGDALFTGDTLFVAGCGRLFEGTAADLHASLTRLAALPAATRVYCGHEYTLQNLTFAASIEPGNAHVAAKLERVRAQRRNREPTVPSTLGEELETNPFLRTHSPEIRERFRSQLGDAPSPAQVFAAVRSAKDRC